MKNMMSGVLATEVVKDINDRMTAIKGEIETLKKAVPPKDYTMETILEWLESIKKAPDQRAVELLIRKSLFPGRITKQTSKSNRI